MAGRLLSLVSPSYKVSIVVGALTLLHSFPSPVYCRETSDDGKDDDSADKLFKDFVKKADLSKVPKIPFNFDMSADQMSSIHDFLKAQLEDGGSLQPVRKVFESGVAGQVGYAFLMGYSSGFCLRKVSKVAAFVLGSAFILVQSLQYGGLIKVNYEGIQQKAESALDLNKDGVLDGKDAQFALDKAKEILGFNMPSGGGFTAGFMMGLRG